MPIAVYTNYLLREHGSRNVQIGGFAMVSLLFIILGAVCSMASYPVQIVYVVYIFLYSALWIPNVTTYVIPTETFTPEVRSSLSGLSAAFGKLGALVGIIKFQMLLQSHGMHACFISCGIISGFGALLTAYGMENEDVRLYKNIMARKQAKGSRTSVNSETDGDNPPHGDNTKHFGITIDEHSFVYSPPVQVAAQQNKDPSTKSQLAGAGSGDEEGPTDRSVINELRSQIPPNTFPPRSDGKVTSSSSLPDSSKLVIPDSNQKFPPKLKPNHGEEHVRRISPIMEEMVPNNKAPTESALRLMQIHDYRPSRRNSDTFASIYSVGVIDVAFEEEGGQFVHRDDVDERDLPQHHWVAHAEDLAEALPSFKSVITPQLSRAPSDTSDRSFLHIPNLPKLDRKLSEVILFREGAETYVPFFEWQRHFLTWIHKNFNHPLFKQWNYCWHLIPKTPVQLMIHCFILGIGPGTIVQSFYIIILGHVLWSGPWLLKDFYQVPRPSWVLPFGFDLAISERNWSFPSGHTMGLSGTFLLLALIFGSDFWLLWVLYVLMTLLTCIARTALRMHWPLDTFGSCIIAPVTILPLYYMRTIVWEKRVTSSEEMLEAAILVFLTFFCTHTCCHFYVKAYLPVPSIVEHIANDPTKFKYTNVMGGIRNSLFLLGAGLGVFLVWEIRDPHATVCPFETGLQPALMSSCTAGAVLLVQNFFRNWWCETEPWTTRDYQIKFAFAPLVGFFAVINAAGLIEFSMNNFSISQP